MIWIELSAQTDGEGAEAAAAVLNGLVQGGAVVEETVTPEPGEKFDPARAFTVRAFFQGDDRAGLERAQAALWHLGRLRAISPRTREVKEEDWAEAWKKHFTILHVGDQLVIKPSWLDYTPRLGEVMVELDPGMAFGSGLHPTTRMCLHALGERMRTGMNVLDVGTGSGILAIAAAKLGARAVLALDTDPIAVETATKNAAINKVDGQVQVKRSTHDISVESKSFDLICVNILAETATELAPTLAASLGANGVVIASGILDFKADGVVAAFLNHGIKVFEKKQEDDWVTLVASSDR